MESVQLQSGYRVQVLEFQLPLCARLQALQSKLAREGGRLTALAQQSFGEMALPSALQQALGGGGGSASSLISTLRGFQARE